MRKFTKTYPKTARFISGTKKALQVGMKAYSIAKTIASIVNSEKKFFDVAPRTINTDTTATVESLSSIVQGSTEIARNGVSVGVKSLQIEGTISYDNINKPSESIRIVVFRANDNIGGVLPTYTELYEGSNVISLRNKDSPQKYTVLFDRLFNADMNKTHSTFKLYKKFNMMKDKKGNPIKQHHITWTGANGVDWAKGHLFIAVLGTVATADTLSFVTYTSRVRFYDN